MKHLITFILLFFSSTLLFGQQIPNFGLFQQNISFYNPSATAHQTRHYGTIQYNTRLTNFKGNPTTFIAQYEKDLESKNSGIGVLMYQDKTGSGFATYNIGTLQYRYTIKTGEESDLMLGASAGVFHSKHSDIFTFGNTIDTLEGGSQGKFTMNAGVSYQWKNLYVGISAVNATQPKFDRINFESNIHYVAHTNYIFDISDQFTISPQAMFLTDAVKASITLNVKFEHYNRFWYLGGIRNTDSFMVGAGIQFWDKMYIGYLYEHYSNNFGITYPSHEAFVTFKINND